jgi:hypothetical protein
MKAKSAYKVGPARDDRQGENDEEPDQKKPWICGIRRVSEADNMASRPDFDPYKARRHHHRLNRATIHSRRPARVV